MVLEANLCAPGDSKRKEPHKETEKVGLPQTTRYLKYQISAVPHSGT